MDERDISERLYAMGHSDSLGLVQKEWCMEAFWTIQVLRNELKSLVSEFKTSAHSATGNDTP
jgi:hypothetical protein